MLMKHLLYIAVFVRVTESNIIPIRFKHYWFASKTEKTWLSLTTVDIVSTFNVCNDKTGLAKFVKCLHYTLNSRHILRLHKTKSAMLQSYMQSDIQDNTIKTTLKYLPLGTFKFPLHLNLKL